MNDTAATLHEIRTPLQTIMSTLELLGDTKLDKEQQEYLHQLNFSTNVMLQITNNVLDYSKIQNNSLKLESIPIDLVTLAEDITDLISLECFSKNVELITDIDFNLDHFYLGDSIRLQQIILNLLKNAVKFTSDGYVKLHIYNKGCNILFDICDTGIGMSKEQKEKLFTEYYQASEDTTRKYGGTGLGLSISKKLAKLMNGDILVLDNLPKGTIFRLSIPANFGSSCFTNDLIIPFSEKILIVDSCKPARDSLQSKLLYLGLDTIIQAEDGEKAFKLIEEASKEGHPFTVAFISMKLKQMDGWRLASLINSQKKLNDVKLILMIPEGQIGKDAKMKLLGWYNSYLYKPIKRKNLIESLNTVWQTPLDLEPVEDEITILPDKQEEKQTNHPLKIAIAEDHPVNIKLLTNFIEKLDALCISATDGSKIVNLIKDNPDTDIIFMDIGLPEITGDQAAVLIRQQGYTGRIIACTANNDTDIFKQYKECGIDDLLLKPYKRQDVISLINKWTEDKTKK